MPRNIEIKARVADIEALTATTMLFSMAALSGPLETVTMRTGIGHRM